MLSRRMNLSVDAGSTREALREIVRQSGLDLMYSEEIVPIGQKISLHAEGITVAAALTDILLDAGVDVVFTRRGAASLVKRTSIAFPQDGTLSGRVVDARTQAPIADVTVFVEGTPLRSSTSQDGRYRITNVPVGSKTVTARRLGYLKVSHAINVGADVVTSLDFALSASANLLDQVVVTGTLRETSPKELPSPISLVTSADIERHRVTAVQDLFHGIVPGIVSVGNATANGFGEEVNNPQLRIRGGSSFGGNSTIKIYIDGIEMADPAVLQAIDPAMIDRIELVRGPQASTLYGAGALEGVMQIFTRKGSALAHPHISGNASYSMINSQYVAGAAPMHTANVRVEGGTGTFSYNLGGGYQRIGEWLPEYHVLKPSLYLGTRYTTGPLTIETTSRFADERITTGQNPVIAVLTAQGLYGSAAALRTLVPGNTEARIPQRTLGLTASYGRNTRLRHSLTIGRDEGGQAGTSGFSGLTAVSDRPRYSTPSDSLLTQVREAHVSRTSVSYNTSAQVTINQNLVTDLTVGADHWEFNGDFLSVLGATKSLGSLTGTNLTVSRAHDSNTGIFGQARLGISDALFITAGIRGERNPNFGESHKTDFSPRLGIAYAAAAKNLTAKFRASYGRAVRPPTPGQKLAAPIASLNTPRITIANDSLGPEDQLGGDAGVDLYYGNRGNLSVTYYSQRVNDLIAAVDVTALQPSLPPPATSAQQFQNVGRVRNSGLELEGSLFLLRTMRLAGTYTVMRSVVKKLAPGFTGIYKVGDRVLGIPERSGMLSMDHTLGRFSYGADMTFEGRRWNSISRSDFLFDRLAPSATAPLQTLPFDARKLFSARAAYQVMSNAEVFSSVENLTNNYEPDMQILQMMMGRRVTIGVRVR
jgi:outer membrane receptor protein involved in Fe transport